MAMNRGSKYHYRTQTSSEGNPPNTEPFYLQMYHISVIITIRLITELTHSIGTASLFPINYHGFHLSLPDDIQYDSMIVTTT